MAAKRIISFLTILISILLFTSHGWASESSLFEAFRVIVNNQKGGEIAISVDHGQNWQAVGKVIKPVTKANKKGFPRSAQAEDNTVCEVAVDRMLFKIGQNYEDSRFPYGRGSLFGLASAERHHLDKNEGINPSLIYTDIPSGKLIFGKYSPLLGNTFFVKSDGQQHRTAPEFEPQKGDVFIIIVETNPKLITDIVFENKFGGTITANYAELDQGEIIGQVLRPVEGIGRFIGTEFVGPGEIRQAHGNAIGVSTSSKIKGKILSWDKYRGGFQIVTNEHIYDSELSSARTSPQWMVVGPARDNEMISLSYPLFSGYIFPTMKVDVRIDGGDWEPFPEMNGSSVDAFSPQKLTDYFVKEKRHIRRGITHIRFMNSEF